MLMMVSSVLSVSEGEVHFSEENMVFQPGDMEELFPWKIFTEKVKNEVDENDVQPDEYEDFDLGLDTRIVFAHYMLDDITCAYYSFEFYEEKLIKIQILLQTEDPDGPQPDRDEITRVFEAVKAQFPVDEMEIDTSSQSAVFHRNTYYKSANYISDKTCLAIWAHRATDKSPASIGVELKDRIFFEGVKEVYPENPGDAYDQFDEDEEETASNKTEYFAASTPKPTVTPILPTPTPTMALTPLPEITLDLSDLPILPNELMTLFIWNTSEDRVKSILESREIVPDSITNNRNNITVKYVFGDWQLEISFNFDYSGRGLIAMTYTVSPNSSGKQPTQEEIARMVEYFKSLFSLSGMSKDMASSNAQIYSWTCWKADSYKDSSKMLSFFGHRYAGRTGAYIGVNITSTYYYYDGSVFWNSTWEDDAYGQIDYEDYDYPDLPDDISDEDQALFSKSGRLNIPMPFESPTSQPKVCFWVDTPDNYTFRVAYPRIKTTSFYPITVQFNAANPDVPETIVYNYQIFDFHNSCNECLSPTDSKHGIGVVGREGSIRLQPGRYCVYLKNSGLQDFDIPPYLTTIADYSWCYATPEECDINDLY